MMVFCSAFYAGLHEKGNSSYMRNIKKKERASSRLLWQGHDSRFLTKDNGYLGGTERFAPYFMIRTMGCLAQREGFVKDGASEYEQTIRFSRPLLGLLYEKGLLKMNAEFDVAKKIVYPIGSNQRSHVSVC